MTFVKTNHAQLILFHLGTKIKTLSFQRLNILGQTNANGYRI